MVQAYSPLLSAEIHICLLTKIQKCLLSVLFMQWELRRAIEETVKTCPHSLFIFDECDKMPAGLLQDVQRYLKHFKHSISIFLR